MEMIEPSHTPEDLSQLYRVRFQGASEYRSKVWEILTRFLERWIAPESAVLDLGCGYCEFINKVHCRQKFAMDLNPDSVRFAESATLFEQDGSLPWPLRTGFLDVVFSSNFFEHLTTKAALESTLVQALRCLKPGGRLIAMGPNARYLAGAYWDFFDHYLPLTDRSLVEVLSNAGFDIEVCFNKFMPYTIVGRRQYPSLVVRAYLGLPVAWKFWGKQLLVVARKPE